MIFVDTGFAGVFVCRRTGFQTGYHERNLMFAGGTDSMIRILLSALLALAALTFCRPASAEQDRRMIDESRIPVDGALTTDFVPVGWMIESALPNDLNGDGKPDVVLELIESLPLKTEEEMPPSRARALVILLQTKTGGYRRVAVARRLLRCSTCFGTMAGAEGGGAEIKVVKRVIIVEELWGSRETVNTRLRFRHDSHSGHVVLIGEDIELFDRATGSRLRKSSNLLTGIKLTEAERYDEKQDRLIKIPKNKQPIPKIKRFIEDIDYEQYEQQVDR